MSLGRLPRRRICPSCKTNFTGATPKCPFCGVHLHRAGRTCVLCGVYTPTKAELREQARMEDTAEAADVARELDAFLSGSWR